MKRLFIFSLTVILLGSLILAGCGKTAETVTETVSTTVTVTETVTVTPPPPTTTPSAAINWEDAWEHEGETATVTGPVVGVEDMGEGIGKYLVYLGDEFAGHIAMILYDDVDKFPSLDDYVGQTVEVTGEIYMNPFRQQSETACTEASQIVIK